MAEVYLDILAIICIGLIFWGLIRPERIYQYPFFMGSIFVSFLLPQAYSLVRTPGLASVQSVERVLLVSCSCAAMCWIGYQFKPRSKWLKRSNVLIDYRKLLNAGIALTAIAYSSSFLIARTTFQFAENGNLTGVTTIYIFFSQTIYIAFAIFFLQMLKQPNVKNISLSVIASIPILQTIILYGRRQPAFTFIVILGLSLWLVRRYLPPRGLVIVAIASMVVLIPLIGSVRGGFWDSVFNGDWDSIFSASQEIVSTMQEGKILELRNASMLMDAAEQVHRYGYGTGFWDSVIFQYVPGQIVGYDIKESLQFKNMSSYDLYGLYGYAIPNGSTVTGVGDSFVEFGYFGCITFACIAYLFKNLWISATFYKSDIAQLLYIGLVSPAMVSLTHGIGRFLQEAIFQVIFVGMVFAYARVKIKRVNGQPF